MTAKALPNYVGTLRPAPWSEIKFSPETVDLLRIAAARSCPACFGHGYIHDRNGLTHLCSCINRPLPEP